MAKPNLLYISPVVPSPVGGGLAMRAYHNLLALTSTYSVHLLIIPAGLRHSPPEASLSRLCHRVVYFPINPIGDFRVILRVLLRKMRRIFTLQHASQPREWESVSRRRMRWAAKVYAAKNFDVIHVFRLYMLPYASLFLNKRFSGIHQLDLDDVESLTRRNLSELYLINGNETMALQMAHEAQICEHIESHALPQLDRIFVCSNRDRERIGRQYGCRMVEVVPNIVQVPELRQQDYRAGCFTFLLCGSFWYYPNVDALIYFCNEILPVMRRYAQKEFAVRAIGYGIPRGLVRKLSAVPEIKLVGRVPNVTPFYERAHAAVIPLRAGGGTRIKVLEAFAHRIPVVSTSKGVEGLAVDHEKHVLLGDTASSFAQQCCRLMMFPELGKTLSDSAFSLVNRSYNLAVVKEVLCRPKHETREGTGAMECKIPS